tara:strand:- start:826 stop:1260 length:435 start_codon:yes stop_codon:yes gene_type:complete
MKTSKIKEVVSMNPWKSKNGKTIIYHSLVMENEDKINIGKMKEQQIGWELTYEILEEGQQEYNKAKAVAPQNFNSSGFKGNDDRQVSIIRQSSLKCAVEYLKGAEASLEEVFEAADKFIDWVNQKPIKQSSEPVNNGVKDDLPF